MNDKTFIKLVSGKVLQKPVQETVRTKDEQITVQFALTFFKEGSIILAVTMNKFWQV